MGWPNKGQPQLEENRPTGTPGDAVTRCPGGLNENWAAESTLSWLLSLLSLYDLTPGNKQTGDNDDHEEGD